MKAVIFLILLFFSVTSCSFEFWREIDVQIAESHPYIEASGKWLWYKLRYFNGQEIIEKSLLPGTKSFTIKVLSGGLRPVEIIPLGRLSSLGGFYEPGDERVVLTFQDGEVAGLLIDASDVEPDAISRFSISWLKKIAGDITIVNQSALLRELYSGTISNDSLEYNLLFHLTLDSLPSGYWISDSSKSESFLLDKSGEEVTLSLLPGIYRFWNMERSLLSTLILTEDGSCHTKMESFDYHWL